MRGLTVENLERKQLQVNRVDLEPTLVVHVELGSAKM